MAIVLPPPRDPELINAEKMRGLRNLPRIIDLRPGGLRKESLGAEGGGKGSSVLQTHSGLSDMPSASNTDHDGRYFTETELGLATTPGGASNIGVYDSGGVFTTDNVNAALVQLGPLLAQVAAIIAAPVLTQAASGAFSAEYVPTAGDGITLTPGSGTLAWAAWNGWKTLFKTTDQAKASDTTVAADSALQFAADASSWYLFKGTVFYTSNVAADFKWSILCSSAPTAAYGKYNYIIPDALTTEVHTSALALPTDIALLQGGLSSSGGWIEWEFMIQTNGAATISFGWAQNTSNGSNTTVLAGSNAAYRKLR